MDITPFTILHLNDLPNTTETVIRPSCKEDNVVDYAVWINNKLAFTIAYSNSEKKRVVALKNADDNVDDLTVQQIGLKIENHNKINNQ